MQCTGRGFYRIAVDSCTSARTYDKRVNTGAHTRASDSSEIAHIGHAIEHHQQRRLAFIVQTLNQTVQRRELYRTQESNHTLVVLVRELIQFLQRHTLDLRTRSF